MSKRNPASPSRSQSRTKGKKNSSSGTMNPYQARANFTTCNLLGQCVEVQLSDGTWYQGYFGKTTKNSLFSCSLRFAQLIVSRRPDGTNELSGDFKNRINISAENLVQVVAKEIIFPSEIDKISSSEGFKTDTAISGSGEIKERELQPWKPDGDLPEPSWKPSEGTNSNWDQFSTNEKLFGVKTSFDEDIYTTKLDKDSDFYKKNEQRAAKLAHEISKEGSSNVHIASDRGLDMEADVDEESLYGAVIRDSTRNDKYIPPGKRTKSKERAPAKKAANSFVSSSNPVPSKKKEKERGQKTIGEFYCGAMKDRNFVDPSRVDPRWKSTGGSYLAIEEEPMFGVPLGFNPHYAPGPMMGYPPQMPMMGYPPQMMPPGYVPGYPGPGMAPPAFYHQG